MKISSQTKKYLIIFGVFLLVYALIFVITLSFNVKTSDYFASNVSVTEVNAGETEGGNNVYTMPLSNLTTKKYSSSNLKYYDTITLNGRTDKTSSILSLRQINFKVKSNETGTITLKIDCYDSLISEGSYSNVIKIDLKANEDFSVSSNTSIKFSGITDDTTIKISVIANEDGGIANPDNISFAIYDLGLKK